MEEKNVTLHPVFAMHGYAVDMPGQSGTHLILSDKMQPVRASGDRESIVLHSGEEAVITIDSRIHDCEPDCVEIANCHFGKRAVFSYREIGDESGRVEADERLAS